MVPSFTVSADIGLTGFNVGVGKSRLFFFLNLGPVNQGKVESSRFSLPCASLLAAGFAGAHGTAGSLLHGPAVPGSSF